jgi:uncharacterized membrane protein
MSYKDALPPPAVLTKYNEAVPNAAERILAMAGKQSEHRQRLEARVIASNTFNQTLGSIFAFVLGLVAIGGVFISSELEKARKDLPRLSVALVSLAESLSMGDDSKLTSAMRKRRAFSN